MHQMLREDSTVYRLHQAHVYLNYSYTRYELSGGPGYEVFHSVQRRLVRMLNRWSDDLANRWRGSRSARRRQVRLPFTELLGPSPWHVSMWNMSTNVPSEERFFARNMQLQHLGE